MTSVDPMREDGETAASVPSRNGAAAILVLQDVGKRYPGVNALTNVSFDLRPGEVHVLFGENGAGKSTLISIVSGATRQSSGTLLFQGEPVNLESVYDARKLGISAVYQEFSLVPQLTVAENMMLGHEAVWGPFLRPAAVKERADQVLRRLGFPLDPDARIEKLSRAERQMVEIAKAFTTNPSVLILDEPTASLTERETDQLFSLVAALKDAGVGIIYITHRMGEIRQIGDRVTVLRDGRLIETNNVADIDDGRLIELMTGRVIDQVFPQTKFRPGRELLCVRGLKLDDVDLGDSAITVRAGEIVGIAGLVGSGKGEVGRACFGLEQIRGGRIVFDGKDVTGSSTAQMLEHGLGFLPSDRHAEGLMLGGTVRENMSLSALKKPEYSGRVLLRRNNERVLVEALARKVDLRPCDPERPVEQFSGGNQQKVMIAKILAHDLKVVIFDEPTVGVDVGTRSAIYEIINDLCEAGIGVLLISSDLTEILHLTNRTYVMYRGQLAAELSGDEITETNVLSHCFERAELHEYT